MRHENSRTYLGVRTDAIDLPQFEVVNSEILLRSSKSEALGSLDARATTTSAAIAVGRAPLNPQLRVEVLLHRQHRSVSLSRNAFLSL